MVRQRHTSLRMEMRAVEVNERDIGASIRDKLPFSQLRSSGALTCLSCPWGLGRLPFLKQPSPKGLLIQCLGPSFCFKQELLDLSGHLKAFSSHRYSAWLAQRCLTFPERRQSHSKGQHMVIQNVGLMTHIVYIGQMLSLVYGSPCIRKKHFRF